MGERSTRIQGARSAGTWVGSPRRSLLRETHLAASTWIGTGAQPPDRTDAAKVVMTAGPAPDGPPLPLERGQEGFVHTGLGVDEPADGVEARPLDRVLRGAAVVQDRPEHPDERRPEARPARGAERQLEAAVTRAGGRENQRGGHHARHSRAGPQRLADEVDLAEHAVQVQ